MQHPLIPQKLEVSVRELCMRPFSRQTKLPGGRERGSSPALLGTCAHHRNYTEGATERVWNTARDAAGVGTVSASGDHTLTPQRFYVKHKVTLR